MVANKTGLYIVDPERKRSRAKQTKGCKRQRKSKKAYYARKYMEIHAARY